VARSKALAPLEDITRSILILRGHRVILDADLAALYGVPTKRLNEQVRRNTARFPEDFTFQLTADEAAALRSQFCDRFPQAPICVTRAAARLSCVAVIRLLLSHITLGCGITALRGERQPGDAEDTAYVLRETFKPAPRGAQKGVRRHPGLRSQAADRQGLTSSK
jgi:hypothetical protein